MSVLEDAIGMNFEGLVENVGRKVFWRALGVAPGVEVDGVWVPGKNTGPEKDGVWVNEALEGTLTVTAAAVGTVTDGKDKVSIDGVVWLMQAGVPAGGGLVRCALVRSVVSTTAGRGTR